MSDLKFKSCVEARAYVYTLLGTMLEHELTDDQGWMFGGIDNDFDRRRLVKEIEKAKKVCLKRAAKLRGV